MKPGPVIPAAAAHIKNYAQKRTRKNALRPVALMGLLLAAAAQADSPTRERFVDTLADRDSGPAPFTFRQLIRISAPGDIIKFNVTGTMVLTNELVIDRTLTIIGPGAKLLTISGNNNSRVFRIPDGVRASISGMRIANGKATTNNPYGPKGGGIYNQGSLSVMDSVISHNSVNALTGGVFGGGIYSESDRYLDVINSTVSSNSATGHAGSGAGIYGAGDLKIYNSTIAGNFANDFGFETLDHTLQNIGGGICGQGAEATLNVFNCTINNNSVSGARYAAGGGGIAFLSSRMVLSSSIVAGNSTTRHHPDGSTSSRSPDLWCSLAPGSGNNLIGTVDRYGSGWHRTDILDTDPLLFPLQDNGGPTPTMAFDTNSAAIDAGADYQFFPLDQRGFRRIVDFPGVPNRAGSDGTDIGALELQTLTNLFVFSPEQPGAAYSLRPNGSTVLSKYATNAVTYQWQFNGNDISGATTSAFLLTNLQSADIGDYSVVLAGQPGINTFPVASVALICVVSNTVTGSGMVVPSPNQSSYSFGSNVILTAVAASNQVFQSWSGDASGTNNPLTVTMTNDFNLTANFIFNSNAPALDPINSQTVIEGVPLSLTITGHSFSVGALRYSLGGTAPTNATLNQFTGQFLWAPHEAQGPGTYDFIVRVWQTNTPSLVVLQTFTVTVLESNQPPVIGIISNQTVMQWVPLNLAVTATDVDNPSNPLFFSLAPGAPENADIDPLTGAFSWTPNQAQGPGDYPITVRVTDLNLLAATDSSLITTQTFLLTVIPLDPTNASLVCAPSGLVAWWPGAGNANDIIGANDGTLLNGTTFAPGRAGQAFSFDGIDDMILIGGTAIQPPWTAEMWVNRQDSPSQSSVLLVDNASALKLEQTSFNRQVGFTRFGVADYVFDYSAPVGVWVHLAFVATPTNTSLYVSGVLSDTVATNIPLPMAQLSGNNAGGELKGLLDELSVYNRALSETEIRDVYVAGAAGKCLPPVYMIGANRSANTINLSWLAQKGMTYRVQYKANLNAATPWIDVSDDVTAIGATASKTVGVPANEPQRFYRVVMFR